MSGGFHYYFDAARALWEMPSEELYSMARGGEPGAMQRAAELTLRLKAEYVTPESYRDERTVMTSLASALSDDPEFPLDLALHLGRRRSHAGPPEDIKWVTRRSPRSITLWVAVIAAVSLLVLDVLATAGVPVPTPIGDLLDRVTGEDDAPQTPAPPAPTDARTGIAPRAKTANARSKNENHQNGKDRDFQTGRVLYYKNGKDRNFQKGRNQGNASRDRSRRNKVRPYALERASSAPAAGRAFSEPARKRRKR